PVRGSGGRGTVSRGPGEGRASAVADPGSRSAAPFLWRQERGRAGSADVPRQAQGETPPRPTTGRDPPLYRGGELAVPRSHRFLERQLGVRSGNRLARGPLPARR